MPNLLIMMLRSLLAGVRTQATMQTEILALRHQLLVLKRTQTKKRLLLYAADRWLWVGSHDCGRAGVPPWSSSNRRPSSPNTDKVSAGIGPGRFVTVEQDVRVSQKKLAI